MGAEFNIAESLIDLMYRQSLVWSGSSFCPMLPIASLIGGFLQIYFKQFEIMKFTRTPDRPMGVAKQNQFFRGALVLALMGSLVPYTFFLRRTASCGPHSGERIADNFMSYIDQLPSWFATILAYFSNVILLWIIIFVVFLGFYFVRRSNKELEEEKKLLEHRLKMERTEKICIIRSHRIKFDVAEQAGREMFKSFMNEEMGELGQLYSSRLIELGYGDLTRLLRMSDDDLYDILVHQAKAPESHARIMVNRLNFKRIELVQIV
eukprot:TRINITY_DN4213_c0_g1_i3.p1 TRINITY_DN4213_c0_g1~~TRINITY_DN4213_c0_g1_i3.p1  ORF type:complete len:274 (-),score=75.97 TRINITY_DN4213_c0_g1_i3:87-878(-)